jgi:phage baseplate assembly protein W
MSGTIQTRYFVGFSTVDTSVKRTQYTDLDLIKKDLINALYTKVGERVMMPTYGCIIWDMLFEPLTADNISLIQQNVTEIVEADGRIVLNDVIVTQYDSGIQLQLDLYYQPLNLVDQFKITFDQSSLGLISQ